MTWVLLRGLMREQRHWGAFPELLSQHLNGSRVIAIDLPGNGSLHRERSPASVEAMAQWCRQELLRRELPPPYKLLALSLGAMVTVAWGEAEPAELRSAVLINTSLRPYSAFHERLRPAAWPLLVRMALTAPDPQVVETAILRLTSEQHAHDCELLGQWVAWRRNAPVSRANALRQLMAAARFQAPRKPPSIPLLLLAGGKDRLASPRCSEQLARAWQCDRVVHPEAGHDLPLDDGRWVARQVRDWEERTRTTHQ